MSKRSRAAERLAAQKQKEKEREELERQRQEEGPTKHLSKYAAKKLAQAAAARSGKYDYDDDVETNESDTESSEYDNGIVSSVSKGSHESDDLANTDAAITADGYDASADTDTDTGTGTDDDDDKPMSRRVRSYRVNEGQVKNSKNNGSGHDNANGKGKSKGRRGSIDVARTVRSAIDGVGESDERVKRRKLNKIADDETLPEKVRESRKKRRQHIEDIHDARAKVLADLESRGETYKRPTKVLPDKIKFEPQTVQSFGIETKDRMPDLTDPLERAAAMTPHNRRDYLLFAPIKRHNKPIQGTDFMVKFLDKWSKQYDKAGIFAQLLYFFSILPRHIAAQPSRHP